MAPEMLPTPDTANAAEADAWPLTGSEIIARARLKALQRRSDGPGFVYLAIHLGALAVTATLIYLTLGTIWVVPAIFLHGVVMVLLFAPLHECTHGTAFRTRWLNHAVAWLCGAVILRPPLYFKYRHASHHTYTQHSRKDPDIVEMPGSITAYLRLVLGVSFWGKLVGTLYRGATGRFNASERQFIPDVELKRVSRETQGLCVLYAAIAAIAIPAGSWAPVLYWLLPRFVGEPVLRMIRMAEHTGAAETPNLLENTRTTLTNPIMRTLYWNMPFHAEHHLASSVPFHALPQLHRETRQHLEQVAPGYVAVHRDLIATIRRTAKARQQQAAA